MIEDFSFLLECPSCDAVFWPQNNILMRAGTTPQADCKKCLAIQSSIRN